MGVTEARRNLDVLVDRVAATRRPILITHWGKPVVIIIRTSPSLRLASSITPPTRTIRDGDVLNTRRVGARERPSRTPGEPLRPRPSRFAPQARPSPAQKRAHAAASCECSKPCSRARRVLPQGSAPACPDV
ncbi:type II toxin-antitoxin system Phd/YefM family antitoxin [Pengzhenrongella sp.]|uniref:type II toxin-antitoxin system Phd/YefM family antitoxin n=1 Tax=Pengzhenrongella sp. TaxID=2888820 RepID=UPI0039C920D9